MHESIWGGGQLCASAQHHMSHADHTHTQGCLPASEYIGAWPRLLLPMARCEVNRQAICVNTGGRPWVAHITITHHQEPAATTPPITSSPPNGLTRRRRPVNNRHTSTPPRRHPRQLQGPHSRLLQRADRSAKPTWGETGRAESQNRPTERTPEGVRGHSGHPRQTWGRRGALRVNIIGGAILTGVNARQQKVNPLGNWLNNNTVPRQNQRQRMLAGTCASRRCFRPGHTLKRFKQK